MPKLYLLSKSFVMLSIVSLLCYIGLIFTDKTLGLIVWLFICNLGLIPFLLCENNNTEDKETEDTDTEE